MIKKFSLHLANKKTQDRLDYVGFMVEKVALDWLV
jgi:hypothetical protein